MLGDVHGDEGIAGDTAVPRTRIALPLQPDLLTAGEAGRNLDVDLLAGRQVQPPDRAVGGVLQTDGQRRLEIARRWRLVLLGEIFRLELRRAAARASATKTAEHVAQDILEAAATTRAATALETVGTPRLEMSALTAAAGLRTETLEAAEARLALGID